MVEVHSQPSPPHPGAVVVVVSAGLVEVHSQPLPPHPGAVVVVVSAGLVDVVQVQPAPPQAGVVGSGWVGAARAVAARAEITSVKNCILRLDRVLMSRSEAAKQCWRWW